MNQWQTKLVDFAAFAFVTGFVLFALVRIFA